MDPEARVVVTGRDATGAAFASAEKTLNRFGRNVYQLKNLLAGFGVIVSGRMFANWIKDSIELNKLTAEQADKIGGATKAMGELNNEFQNLARTAAAELAPALEHAAKFWKEFFFPSSSQYGAGADQLMQQVDKQIEEVTRLQTLLNSQSGDRNWFQRMLFGDGKENISETTGLLAEARAELERLRSQLDVARGGAAEPWNPLSGMHRIGDFADRNAGAKRSQVAIDYLDEFEEITVQARRISEDELLKPFPADAVKKMFEPMEKEAFNAAAFIGDSFRGAFTSWLSDGEFKFRDFLRRMAAELASSALFSYLGSAFSGATGGAGKFFANFFGGARASGGPVSAGKSYIVGERGPEWFVPKQSGAIVPSGGGTVVQHFHIEAGLPPQWSAQLATAAQMAASAANSAVAKRQRGER